MKLALNLAALAARNALRNRRRSLATVIAITLGSVAILLFGGYVRSTMLGLQTGAVRSSGHLHLEHNGYALYGSSDPARYSIDDVAAIIAAVKSDPQLNEMIEVITPVMQFYGIAGNYAESTSRTVIGFGLVPQDREHLSRWDEYGLGRGQRPQDTKSPLASDQHNPAVIGQGLARVLHLCAPLHVSNCPAPSPSAAPSGAQTPTDIADLAGGGATATSSNAPSEPKIDVLAATQQGAPNVVSLTPVAAQNQGIQALDDAYLAMPLNLAQSLVFGRAAHDRATGIEIQLKHTRDLAAVRARLRTLVQEHHWPLEVRDFTQFVPSYLQIVGMFRSIFGFITVLIAAIVLFTVANTMAMAVSERTVEIGTLRAMGLRRSGSRRLFLLEGVLLGLVGAFGGLALALVLAFAINHAGLSWTPPNQVRSVPFNVRLWDDGALIVGISVLLTVVASLSAVLPARRAARLEIVEALAHN